MVNKITELDSICGIYRYNGQVNVRFEVSVDDDLNIHVVKHEHGVYKFTYEPTDSSYNAIIKIYQSRNNDGGYSFKKVSSMFKPYDTGESKVIQEWLNER